LSLLLTESPPFRPFVHEGDEEDRTPDLGIANAAPSQLSHIPTFEPPHNCADSKKQFHFETPNPQKPFPNGTKTSHGLRLEFAEYLSSKVLQLGHTKYPNINLN
jgi:hypothetical protein